MKTYTLKLKVLIGTLAVVLSLNACNKKQDQVVASMEEAVLLQSPFHPGEQSPGADEALPAEGTDAPRVAAAALPGGDGGFIGGPGGSTSGGDTGSIGMPGGSTSGGTTSSGSTSSGSSDTSSGSTSGSSSGSTSSGTSSGDTSSSSGSTSGSTGGSDGGTIGSGSGSTSGSDGGVIAGGGTTSGGDTGSTSGGTTSGGTTSSGGDTSGGSTSSGGDTASNGGSTSGGTTSGGDTSSGSTSGSTGGNDGGTIGSGSGSTSGSDGGSVASGGGSTSGGDTGSGSTGGGDTSGGTTSGGGTSSGGDTASNGGDTSGGSTSGGGTSSGGSTGGSSSGGSTGGNDTGSTGTGGGVANNDNGNSTHGNNGVGNGVDPQPPGNPPINDAPGTSPGNPGNQGGSPSGSDHGHSCSNKPPKPQDNDGDDDHLCSCKCSAHLARCRDYKRKMNIVISRVCSVRRSAMKDFIFFEEAKHRILTIEATVPKELESKCVAKVGRDARYASVGMLGLPERRVNNISYPNIKDSKAVRFLIGHWDLKDVDLMKGKYKTQVDLSLRKMRDEFGSLWKNAKLSVHVCEDGNKNGFCGDEKGYNNLALESPSFTGRRVPSTVLVDVWANRYKTRAGNPELCEKQYSPIVMDLTGAGINLIGPESGVQFDLNATGNPVWTGWVKSQTAGFLVRDLNGNGNIDSGAELFGNATTMSNGVRAVNGFEAMKDLDSNGDGKLNSDDSAWRDLMVWVDKNADGETNRGELYSLTRLQVESFNLNYVEMMEVDNFGNQTRQRSTFVRRIKGKLTPLQVIDVWFNTLGE